MFWLWLTVIGCCYTDSLCLSPVTGTHCGCCDCAVTVTLLSWVSRIAVSLSHWSLRLGPVTLTHCSGSDSLLLLSHTVVAQTLCCYSDSLNSLLFNAVTLMPLWSHSLCESVTATHWLRLVTRIQTCRIDSWIQNCRIDSRIHNCRIDSLSQSCHSCSLTHTRFYNSGSGLAWPGLFIDVHRGPWQGPEPSPNEHRWWEMRPRNAGKDSWKLIPVSDRWPLTPLSQTGVGC